jgi:apolipoprotein N-acyltransferase
LTRGGFRFGWLVGIGFWALHLIWLPQSFLGLFGVWGAIIFIPLVLIKGSFWAVLFGLTVDLPLLRLGGWVLLEYLTSLGDLAFPWGFMGYALADAPGRMLASWGGVYLLSLLVLLVAFGLYKRHYWVLLPWAVLWLIPLPAANPDKTALLVQGNIDVVKKFEGLSVDDHYLGLTRKGLEQYPDAQKSEVASDAQKSAVASDAQKSAVASDAQKSAVASKVQVVVWPETAVQGLNNPDFAARMAAVLGRRDLVSGLETGSVNRVVRFEGGQVREFYDKNRLVPFGESFPLRQLLAPIYEYVFTQMGLPGLGSRPEGNGYQTLGRYGAYICYESVFPSVARNLVRGGAEVLALVSNDAWYGTSFGGEQHFDMGRLRAVETGRWVLRAGNDGVTASIDPYGRAVARLPRYQEGYLGVPYAHLSSQTPYVRFGDWAVVVALATGLFGLRKPRKRYIF